MGHGRADASGSVIVLTVVALVLASVAAPAGTSESSSLLEIDAFELPNGMRFLLVERPRSATVAAGWVVRAGSADDPDGQSGLAHMLEHMLFKGTETIRPGELDVLYARAGATGLNALTQRDLTAYFVSLPAEKLELWFWLESDRLLAPAFRDLPAERDVVREERRLRVEATPTGELEEELQALLWGADPYGRPPTGVPGDLERIGPREAGAFFDRHYGAAGLTAVLVGAFEAPAVRSLAERYFGRLPPTAARASEAPLAPPLAASRALDARCDCRPQARIHYRTVPFGHADAAAVEVLASVLNGRSGRLHRTLVLDRGIAFAAYAEHDELRRGGSLTLTAEGKGESSAAQLLAGLDGEIERLLTDPPSAREVGRAGTRLRADAVRALREPSRLMLRMLIHAGLGAPEHLANWSARIAAVAPEDVERVARTYLHGRPRVTARFDRQSEDEASP